MTFKALWQVLFFAVIVLINSCIEQFVPAISEDRDLLVAEGLITDQRGPDTIKLSTSTPLGGKNTSKPLKGCNVTITDDLGNVYSLDEIKAGTYVTNSSFRGVIGRSYTLHINTNESYHNLNYQSNPELMKPVPPIDSIYYDKLVIIRNDDGSPRGEGSQIYLNTHDPANSCRFYRWEYVETWEFRLPYNVANKVCWVSNNSDKINIKNTSSLTEDRVEKLPLNLITNATDRLRIKYSILVNQYSLNENEYEYWEKLQKMLEEVGGLYDLTPSSIPSNIWCVEKPAANALGYFSVSAVKSKRIFIKDQFRGMPDLYRDCENVTRGYNDAVPGLNIIIWLIVDHPEPPPGYKIYTFFRGCADCAVRGTNIKPDFWDDSR